MAFGKKITVKSYLILTLEHYKMLTMKVIYYCFMCFFLNAFYVLRTTEADSNIAENDAKILDIVEDPNDKTILSPTEMYNLPVVVKKDYPRPTAVPDENLQNIISKYLETPSSFFYNDAVTRYENFNNFCYFNMILWMIIDILDVREGASKQITRAGYKNYVNLIANMILTIPNKLFENDQIRNKLFGLYKAIIGVFPRAEGFLGRYARPFTNALSISSIINDLRSLADLDVWKDSYPVRYLFSRYELGLINNHKDLVNMHKDVCFNELYYRPSYHPVIAKLITVLDIVSNTNPSTINTMMIRALRNHAFHDIETLSQEDIEMLTSPHYEPSAIIMKNEIENCFNIDPTSPLRVEHRAVSPDDDDCKLDDIDEHYAKKARTLANISVMNICKEHNDAVVEDYKQFKGDHKELSCMLKLKMKVLCYKQVNLIADVYNKLVRKFENNLLNDEHHGILKILSDLKKSLDEDRLFALQLFNEYKIKNSDPKPKELLYIEHPEISIEFWNKKQLRIQDLKDTFHLMIEREFSIPIVAIIKTDVVKINNIYFDVIIEAFTYLNTKIVQDIIRDKRFNLTKTLLRYINESYERILHFTNALLDITSEQAYELKIFLNNFMAAEEAFYKQMWTLKGEEHVPVKMTKKHKDISNWIKEADIPDREPEKDTVKKSFNEPKFNVNPYFINVTMTRVVKNRNIGSHVSTRERHMKNFHTLNNWLKKSPYFHGSMMKSAISNDIIQVVQDEKLNISSLKLIMAENILQKVFTDVEYI